MRNEYDNNTKFRKLIKQAIAVIYLPLSDLDKGIAYLFGYADPTEDKTQRE